MSCRTTEPSARRALRASSRLLARAVFVLALLVSLPACLTMKLGDDFLQLESVPHSYRAVTADEAKVWVREFFPEQTRGNLDFWREALSEDFEHNRGYVLLDEREVKDGRGREGHEMLFETQAGGRTQRYLVALFVFEGLFGDRYVRTVEYVAEKERFDERLPEVREGIAALR
jgi:hypothetical protein